MHAQLPFPSGTATGIMLNSFHSKVCVSFYLLLLL